MNQLISTQQNQQGEIVVSGRELNEFMEVKTEYAKWVVPGKGLLFFVNKFLHDGQMTLRLDELS